MTEIRPNVDAWVDQDAPNQNHSATPRLKLRGTGTSHAKYAFLHLPRQFPLGSIVSEATLELHVASGWTDNRAITAERVIQGWREDTIDYSNMPNVDTLNAATVASGGAISDETLISLNLTTMFNDVSDGDPFYGVRLRLTTDVERRVYSGKAETARLRPKLIVHSRVPPDAPDGLRPNSGLLVAATKPVVTWNALGRGEEESSQLQSRVQIASDVGMTTIVHDSLQISNTGPSYDTALTGTPNWSGISAGQTRYWRVMVWDDDGNPSPWSDVASFGRAPKPTVSIVSPSGSVVNDTTPVIAWDVAGGTQASWEAWLYEKLAGNHLLELAHRHRHVTTDETWTLPMDRDFDKDQKPRGFLQPFAQTGKSYRVEVHVWDNEDRIALPNEKNYAIATKDFTYVRDGTVTAPTGLTATASGAGVNLAWTCATMPDYYALTVDGEIVEDRLDSGDAQVSGTSYAYTYWGAKYGVAHTYGIEAVRLAATINKHSTATTASATTRFTGIYLVDVRDNTYVRLGGAGDVALNIREVGTTYDIPSSRRPIRILEMLGGYAGTISGELANVADRDTFLDLKGRVKQLRVIAGHYNFPCFLEEVDDIVQTNEMPNEEPRFGVSVALYQTAEFNDVLEIDL